MSGATKNDYKTHAEVVKEHDHAKYLLKDGDTARFEITYDAYGWINSPFDLRKIDAEDGCDWWIKWHTLYVDIHGTIHEFEGDEIDTDCKRPGGWGGGTDVLEKFEEEELELCDCVPCAGIPFAYPEASGQCNKGVDNAKTSKIDLEARCEDCEKKFINRQIAGGMDKLEAALKIQKWAKDIIYNPHTKIGKRFALTSIAWAFGEDEDEEEEEDKDQHCGEAMSNLLFGTKEEVAFKEVMDELTQVYYKYDGPSFCVDCETEGTHFIGCPRLFCVDCDNPGWTLDSGAIQFGCDCGEEEEEESSWKDCGHKYECGCGKSTCMEMDNENCADTLCENEYCKHYYDHRNDNCDCRGSDCPYCKL